MYRLIVSPDGTENGVQVGRVCIPAVTPHRWEAEALLETLRRNEVSEVHALDVVEDWVAEREPVTKTAGLTQ